MRPFLFLLLILPAGLNAQQTNVSTPNTQLSVGAAFMAAFIDNISNSRSKINDIAATIKSAREQMSSLQSTKNKIQVEIVSLKKQIADIGDDESKKAQKAELEKKLAELTKQLELINTKISQLKSYIDAQIDELNKLEDSIDQMRKKMEETAVRDRQQTENKQMEEIKKTVFIVEEKALAYAHVIILLDSLPPIGSRLSLAERNLVSGLKSKFNNDAEFRSATTAYIKHSKASNYFSRTRKAGTSADQLNRLLIAVKEELVILSRN